MLKFVELILAQTTVMFDRIYVILMKGIQFGHLVGLLVI